MATSTNEDGYHSALQRAWQDQNFSAKQTPTKSSLSEAREKVSYNFFKDIYESDLQRLNALRKTYRGFYIYAMDGDDLDLPRSKDILSEGYKGQPYSKEYETHYPKMYTVFAYDVLNGLIQRFSYSNKYQELRLATEMSSNFEKNSITIYDKLYAAHSVMHAHVSSGSHCLIRMKSDGESAPMPIKKFLASGMREAEVPWLTSRKQKLDTVKIRLVKVINPRTKKIVVFATTLSKEVFSRKEIATLYQKRWEVETAFRDLTHTLKMDQWHSKKLNGILQEIYATLWLYNNVKMQLTSNELEESILIRDDYSRSNFKLCAKLIVDNFILILSKQYNKLRKLLLFWIARSKERRKHRSRSYPRVVKGKQSKFPVHSKVPRIMSS